MLEICKLFLCFLVFSFAGWCLEVTYGYFELKKFVNRGFLIGPICPCYGIGCLLLALLLNGYRNDPIVLFIMSVFICSILEYFTSYILEKLFNARWWDYSNKKYNLNGRICLETLIPFGVLGLLVVYLLFPLVYNAVNFIPNTLIYIISAILFLVLITDIILSLDIIVEFKKTASKIAKDNTEEIAKFVKETFAKNSRFAKRLMDSFPDFRLTIKKFADIVKKNDR